MASAPRLILASASPRRRQILAVLGVPFDVIEVGVDESPQAGESPENLARRLAVAKAEAGLDRRPDDFVLGADTVVALDGESLGKPRNAAVCAAALTSSRRASPSHSQPAPS